MPTTWTSTVVQSCMPMSCLSGSGRTLSTMKRNIEPVTRNLWHSVLEPRCLLWTSPPFPLHSVGWKGRCRRHDVRREELALERVSSSSGGINVALQCSNQLGQRCDLFPVLVGATLLIHEDTVQKVMSLALVSNDLKLQRLYTCAHCCQITHRYYL